jgi:hypothetical protein
LISIQPIDEIDTKKKSPKDPSLVEKQPDLALQALGNQIKEA